MMFYHAENTCCSNICIRSEGKEEVREPIGAGSEISTWVRGPFIVERNAVAADDGVGELEGGIKPCRADNNVSRNASPVTDFDS